MATQVKIVLLALLLVFSACHRTHVPSSYRSGKSTMGSYKYSTYTVRRGDTLYSIGKRFGVDHKLLARRNHIRWPYTIYVGQELSLTRTAPQSRYIPVPRASDKPKQHSAKTSRPVAKKPAKPSYNSPAVNGVSSLKLRWPADGPVTSSFGRDGSRTHDGIDIGAKEGSPVYAAASGEVVYSDHRLTGYGHLIIVRHSRDMFTAYAHNQRNLVKKGDQVKSGEIIARVGKTGRTNGHANLHFEVRRGQTPVNPLAYLPRK